MSENTPFDSESPSNRQKRFEKARERKVLWDPILQEIYRYTIPNADDFTLKNRVPGDARTNNIWDFTALDALQTFATNLQTALMPVLQRWAKLVANEEVEDNMKGELNTKLQETNDIIFEFINKSNLSQAFYESALDLGIGTGVLLMNEGPDEDPLRFTSVRISNVYFEEGENHKLDNFWREIRRLPNHRIKRFWPNAKLPPVLESRIKRDPYGEINLIEGTIFYPDNPKGKEYLYYVQEEGVPKDIVFEWRDYSPWIGFRYSVASGEIMGRGPALLVLPGIRMLNIMTETMRRGAQLRIDPPWLATSSQAFNPYNVNIEPGTVIAVDPNAALGGGDPLKPLVMGGDLDFGQLSLESLQAQIREILFASPLGETPKEGITATEINLRNQEAISKRGPVFGRLLVELLTPLMENIVHVLRKRGLIDDIRINGKELKISFQSPLAQVQDQEDLQRFETWIQLLQNTFGPEALAAVNFEALPEWTADKLNVDPKLVNMGFANSPVVQNLKSQINHGPQQPATPPPAATVPSPQQPQAQPSQVLSALNALRSTPPELAGGAE